MRLTPTQLYYLRRLATREIILSELRKWDQRPLRGLFLRGLFSLTKDFTARITSTGWDVVKLTSEPKFRKNANAPIFKSDSITKVKVAK